MRTKDFIKLSSRALLKKTSRSALTILGMGVGIAAVLFLVSLGFGLRNVMIEEITTAKSFVVLDVMPVDSDFLKLSQDNVNKIQKLEGVKDTSPVKEIPAKAIIGTLTSQIGIFSVNPLFFDLSDTKSQITEGELFKEDEKDKIIISGSLAVLFDNAEESNIGKTVKVKFMVKNENYNADGKTIEEKMPMNEIEKTFEVVGILGENTQSVIFAHHSNFDKYSDSFSLIKVETTDSSMMKEVRQKILDMGLSVSSISDVVEQANKIFKVITVILAVFGVVALLVSAIGMFNTMTITLLERTNEIGIMKSIGASKTDITKLFITEATIMGFLGSVAGVIMGFVGSEIINILFNVMATRMGGESVDIFYTPTIFIILVIVFGSFIGFFTGLFPSRRAGKLDPLEALRYK